MPPSYFLAKRHANERICETGGVEHEDDATNETDIAATGVRRVIWRWVEGVGMRVAKAVVLAVLELAAVRDDDGAHGNVARGRLRVLHTPHYAHALEDLGKAAGNRLSVSVSMSASRRLRGYRSSVRADREAPQTKRGPLRGHRYKTS